MKSVLQLTVLYLEYSQKDIEIVYHYLIGYISCPVYMDTASTEKQFRSYLKNNKYDLILADYTLPGYNVREALKEAQAICPEVPFICLSRTVSADIAVEMIKQGATDYVFKDRLGRLPFVIQRALQGKLLELEMQQHEEHLRIVNASLKQAQKIAHLGSFEWDIRTDEMFGSDEVYRIFGLEPGSENTKIFIGTTNSYMSESDRDKVVAAFEKALAGTAPYDVEYWMSLPDGTKKYVHVRGSIRRDDQGNPLHMLGTYQDLTERKVAEETAKRQAEFQKMVVSLSKDFINMPSDKLDDSIVYSMGLICGYCNVEKSYILRYNLEADTVTCIYEWNSDQNKYGGKRCANLEVPASELIHRHTEGKPFYATGKEAFPENSKSRQIMELFDIKAASFFPLIADGKYIGEFTWISSLKDKEIEENDSVAVDLFCEMLTNVLLRKEQEAALKEANERNRLILDSTYDGIAMMDREGNILNINKHFAQRYGKSVEEMIDCSFKEIMPEDIYGCLYEERLKKHRQVFETGEPVVFEDTTEGLAFHNRYYPIYKEGRVIGVSLFSTDITDRKKAEEDAERCTILQKETEIYKQKEQEYLELLDGSAEGSWIFDYITQSMECSPQWIRRLGGENLTNEEVNQFMDSLIHPDDYERVHAEMKKVSREKLSKYKVEYRIKTVENGYVWVLDQAKVIFNEEGKIQKIYGTSMDITDRKNMELQFQKQAEELEQKNRMITDFFINLSHEFKTPLSILMLGLELLETSADMPGNNELDLKKQLKVMKQNSYRLARLVFNLLDISKLDSGFMMPKWENADIVQILRNIYESTCDYIRQKDLVLNLSVSADEKYMFTDSFMLERIVLNLLSNAIKHTPSGGQIQLEMQEYANKILISVEDNGEGIPEDKKIIIFDRFAQVDTSLSRPCEGCGIGLALSKSLAELLNGKISFESTQGEGSIFMIELPVVEMDIVPQLVFHNGMQLDSRIQLEFSDIEFQ